MIVLLLVSGRAVFDSIAAPICDKLHLSPIRTTNEAGKLARESSFALARQIWPAMLCAMETPENERRDVEEYLRSQSGPEFAIEHVEKLTTEYVLGHQYDVWDAHTNEGRWWLITNPTNLYSQDLIKSMDIALSFHIGLMSRMTDRGSARFREGGTNTWVIEVLRRLETASDNLDRAKEVEDVQAVGMRFREVLLTLIDKFHGLGLKMPKGIKLPEQEHNFKDWASVYAGILAPGPSAERLRKLLKSQSESTWEYLGWLTHARNASITDGRIASSAANELVETFLFAAARMEHGSAERCPACSSYQLTRELAEDGNWLQLCATCGWSEPSEPPRPIASDYVAPDEEAQQTAGECIVAEDFGIYVTPSQARSILEESRAKAIDEDEQPEWTNRFAVRFPEDSSIHDVHRLVFESFNREPASGTELVYECNEDNCVNPKHARELPLPELSWSPMVIERIFSRPCYLELVVANQAGRASLFITRDTLSRYGMGDASSLLERVVVVSEADEDGGVAIIPADRRVDHSQGSVISGWLHPSIQLADNDLCPCGTGAIYGACHGQKFESEAQL